MTVDPDRLARTAGAEAMSASLDPIIVAQRPIHIVVQTLNAILADDAAMERATRAYQDFYGFQSLDSLGATRAAIEAAFTEPTA